MARTFADEIVDTSQTTGVGTYDLDGTGKGAYRPFGSAGAYSNGDATVYFGVRNALNTKWEINRNATFTTGTPNRLTRNVFKSTNANAAVAWTSDDLPLTIYVPSSAEVLEGAVTGWLGTAIHAMLRAGATWLDYTIGIADTWVEKLFLGGVVYADKGRAYITPAIFVPNPNRLWVDKGAAAYVATADDVGKALKFNVTAANRALTLPQGSTLKHGFALHFLGYGSSSFGVVLTPNAGDAVDSGSAGSTLTVPGNGTPVGYSIHWDGAQWRTSYTPPIVLTAGRRQTVAAGPVDTAGLPTFLPSTAGTLSVTSQNVSASAPLVATAADGWNAANGSPVDTVGYSIANLTWAGLTASRAAATPNFLYGTIANGVITPASTILPPVYQWGGAPAVTNGQITFNIGEMKAYLGNGATAPQTNLVLFGEAATDGSGVTSTVPYAYNGRYDSGWTATLTNAGVSKNANLGGEPRYYRAQYVVQCITTDLGWAVGDTIALGVNAGSSQYGQVPVYVTRLTIGLPVYGDVYLSNKGTGSMSTNMAPAKWQYALLCDRGW